MILTQDDEAVEQTLRHQGVEQRHLRVQQGRIEGTDDDDDDDGPDNKSGVSWSQPQVGITLTEEQMLPTLTRRH